MPKYSIYALATASKFVGVVEANSEEEAKTKGWELDNCTMESLCHQCAGQTEIGDIYDLQLEEE